MIASGERACDLDGVAPWPEEFAARYRAAGYWLGAPLGDLLRASARAFPDRVALVSADTRRTYTELDLRADRVAAGLARLGVGARDRVVVQLPNVPEFVELCFALFRLGAIPVMALPGHRRAEITAFCRHARARALVTCDVFDGFDHRELAREVRSSVPELRHSIVVGDAREFVSFGELDAAPLDLPPVDASRIALLQLSGGSTGTPKLIPRTHDDYFYSVRASAGVCGLASNSSYLVALPAAHNFALSSPGILGCLYAGGKVVLCAHPIPDAVFPLIETERITMSAVVPALAQLWLTAATSRGKTLRPLEVLQVGGAKLRPELAFELTEALECRIQQVFGMAEGLVNYTRLDDPLERIATTQGRPLSPADEIRIVDERGREVPEGGVGELLTRGPYTVRGYYAVPEYDRVAFTEDGFYRTGDLVRRTPDGNLVVEGRSRQRINRGGEKVSPEEVERDLLGHPAIQDAAVVGVPDPILGERIWAFVVARPGESLDRPGVIRYLKRQGLAKFKIPDRVELVPALPRTGVGKLDRRALARSAEAKAVPS